MSDMSIFTPMNRREFLGTAAAVTVAARVMPRLALAKDVTHELLWKQEPLEFGAVRLTGGLLKERFDLNARRTFLVAPEDIVTPFFLAKGLPVPGKPLHSGDRAANFTGAWPGLYESFWMSGAAHIARWSGEPAHRETLVRIVEELSKTREADGFMLALGRGYQQRWIHDDLYALVRVTVRCLLDIYEVTGEKAALEMARGQMDSMIRDIVDRRGPAGGLVLRGMDPKKAPPSYYKLLPALAQLYRHTGDAQYAEVAAMCLDQKMMAALLQGQSDPLPGRHASTWVDHLLGVYQLGLMTGNESYTLAALKAADRIRKHHIFVTGSMSSYECFQPGDNGWQLPEASRAQETCCAAIWVTLLESLLRGTGDFVHADGIERAVYNALLASQHPVTGNFCYFLNLAGNGKPHDPPPAFGRHCCEGTGLMAIGRLPGLIYGKTADGLAVNLYADSEASTRIREIPVRVTQKTEYPFEGEVELRLEPAQPVRFTLSCRVPSWSEAPPVVEVNGKPWDGGAVIDREWQSGDHVRLRFAMTPVVLGDYFNNVPRVALRRGPLVFAATWQDELPVRKFTGPGWPPLSSQSHHEQWPYVPSVGLDEKPVASFHQQPGSAYEAEGTTGMAPGAPVPVSRVRLQYVPLLSAIAGKYSVWLPLHRKLS